LTVQMMRSPRLWSAPGGSSQRPRSPRTCARRSAAAGARSTLSTVTAVACVLVAHIGRTSTQPSTDAIEDRRMCARVLARGSQVREGCASERAVSLSAFAIRRKVVILLDELGFAPSGDARASVIRLHHCPLLEAAHRNPRVVCSVHLGVVRGALDEVGADPDRTQSTTLQPFSEPGLAVWVCFHFPRPPSHPSADLPDPGRHGRPCSPGRGSVAARPDRRQGHSWSMAGRQLAACVCLVAGAAWALPCVVTDIPAYDKIIHVVIVGLTMLMITAIAIAFAAQGPQTRSVFSP